MLPAQKVLRKFATLENKRINEWFFKTGKGEYGYGDRFIGVKIPENRKVARQFSALPLRDLKTLLNSPIHEDRALALLILGPRFEIALKTKNKPLQKKLFEFYFSNRHRVNNWDLVDLSAPSIAGAFAFHNPSARKKFLSLASSKSMWDRRIAMVGTFYFIRNERFKETLQLAEKILKDPEDLMHKATGWMLREVGKRDLTALRAFLDIHASTMPRTMLRYAIEKMNTSERKRYLARRIKSSRPDSLRA